MDDAKARTESVSLNDVIAAANSEKERVSRITETDLDDKKLDHAWDRANAVIYASMKLQAYGVSAVDILVGGSPQHTAFGEMATAVFERHDLLAEREAGHGREERGALKLVPEYDL